MPHSTLWVFFSADELPIKEFSGASVVNTDEINQLGQHWVAFFTINDSMECFDSFGRNPAEYSVHIARWLESPELANLTTAKDDADLSG